VQTGVALTNPADFPLSLTLILRDRNGADIANGLANLDLPARGHAARFLEELFAGQGIDLSNFWGTLEVRAPAPILGMALRLGPGDFATLPVTAFP
jgi:hypothetical protein